MATAMDSDGILPVLGGVFGAIGLVMLAVGGIVTAQQVKIVKSWPQVEGTVTSSRVGHYQGSRMMYDAEVEFRYRVAGREYVSAAPDDYSSSSYREMERRAGAYPEGSRHHIRYNPEDPREIRYSAGYTAGFFFLPLIFGGLGLVFTGIAAPMLVVWLRGRRRSAAFGIRSATKRV